MSDQGPSSTAEHLEAVLLHTLFEHHPDRIYFKDEQSRFIHISHAQATSFGLSDPRQAVGKSDFDFFDESHARPAFEDEQEVMRTGVPLVGKVEQLTYKDGRVRWSFTTKAAFRDGQGRVIGTFGVSRDITAIMVAEQQLVEKNHLLEEAVRAKDEAMRALTDAQVRLVESEKLASLGLLVAGVAHEINNPLAFVSNNVAVLQRDVAALRELLDLYAEARPLIDAHAPVLAGRINDLTVRVDLGYVMPHLDELLTRSRHGLKRIQHIVEGLREFARLDTSDLGEVDLNAGIRSTADIIRGRATAKGVRLDLDLAPLGPVSCYPAKINQVVMHLVTNAIDACDADGVVTVRTAQDGGAVLIEVTDTGCGIDPAIQQRIFDPFFTTKPPGHGTGLGLSVSHGIVADHGGTIAVRSSPGQGSTFTVRLPTARR
ncbi:MAG: sensor histidine kinase [Phycisphaerae bacterium]